MSLAEIVASIAACLGALYWVAVIVGVAQVRRQIRVLPAVVDEPPGTWPLLSVIIPACNEVATLEPVLHSLLEGDYPALELVVVDDRSSDGTAERLDAMARELPRIRAVHVAQLPQGWLGKVHAMQIGLQHAQGEWLLFTDADVHQTAGSLRRAVAHATTLHLDLLSAMPRLRQTRPVVDSAVSFFARSILILGQAWRSRDPRSRIATGLGAFILVRRAAVERAGGLEHIRLDVADDMALASLVKQAGGRCDVVNARDAMDIALYPDWSALRGSMEKGGFAIIGRFSVLRTLAMAVLLPALEWSPLASALVSDRPALGVVCALVVSGALLSLAVFERWLGRPAWLAVLAPLGSLLIAGLVARSGLLGWRRGGIQWRTTFYPTPMLRANARHRWP
ncbi:MAG: glycosyltransferase family 2 protein [Pseudomonadota bacterium]